MRRTITVVAADTDASADVRLAADAADRLSDLLPRLREVTGCAGGTPTRNGVVLGPDCRVGDLRIGDVVVLRSLTHDDAATSVDDAGVDAGVDAGLVVHRAPRLVAPPAPVRICYPPAPVSVAPPRLALLPAVVPLVAGAALALLLHQWAFLAFAAMSPLMVVGQAASDRWTARRARARATAERAAAVAAAEKSVEAALADERARRLLAAPDVAIVVTAATSRTPLLWQRSTADADFLSLRVGIGSTAAADVVVDGAESPRLDSVPICLDLRTTPVVGICGDTERAADLARWLVVQAATLHGPATVAVTVLAPGAAQTWGWTRWLPHLRRGDGDGVALAADDEQVRTRLRELREPEARHRIVVVAGGTSTTVADDLAARGSTSVLWLAPTASLLPASCSAVLTVAADGDGELVRTGAAPTAIRTDALSATVAEQSARALAPLQDAPATTAALPAKVLWSSLNDLPLPDVDATAAALRRLWSRDPSSQFCLGVTAEGEFTVDLARDGPHALVAGTTGSGKSELLQALVAGLVAGNSPADLALLLVDFKGGAAFGGCERLPHTAGVLTDLDPAATTRALQSLSAELRRRELLLAGTGAVDFDTWRRRRAHGSDPPTMARLVIVVDEFADLAEQLPDFVGGLVGIARRGRSLGVHLVLATQRPEGAVSADIRANTRLRVCLSVTRDTESRDVIDSPLAATISPTTPGRAFVRLDGRAPVELQTAQVGAPAAATHDSVTVVPLCDWGDPPSTAPDPSTPTELDVLIEAAARAGATIARPPRPWLPPLPPRLPIRAVRTGDGGDAPYAVGLLDRPDEQRQPPFVLAASAEPLLVVGGPRSGRTSAVRTIATALAARSDPNRLHIWAIDGGNGLRDLARLPHTGAVVDARAVDSVERIVVHLRDEIDRRQRRHDPDAPDLLLVVDTWDAVATAGPADGSVEDALLHLVRDGAPAGLRVVVTADRAGLSGRLAAAVSDRVCLRLADHVDYALAGLSPRDVPTSLPPGRGIRVRDRTWLQFALADDEDLAAATRWPPPRVPPRRFAPLPDHVALAALPSARPGRLVMGVRHDDLRAIAVDPAEAGGALLVAGPPRSGRSTVLATIAAQAPHDRVVAVCSRRSRLRGCRHVTAVVDPHDAPALDAALTGGAVTLLVDDIDEIDAVDAPALLDRVEAAVRAARGGAGLVAMAGNADTMLATFRGPVAQARAGRFGVLLHPQPRDGELLGLRLPHRRCDADPPGRGLLVVHGRAVSVQVADPL